MLLHLQESRSQIDEALLIMPGCKRRCCNLFLSFKFRCLLNYLWKYYPSFFSPLPPPVKFVDLGYWLFVYFVDWELKFWICFIHDYVTRWKFTTKTRFERIFSNLWHLRVVFMTGLFLLLWGFVHGKICNFNLQSKACWWNLFDWCYNA